jgi:hypothetical protein
MDWINTSYKTSTSQFLQIDLSQFYRNIMQFSAAIFILPDTIRYIDQMCLSDNEVQQMHCKQGERSNQSHTYVEADQILQRHVFHARGWCFISRTNILRLITN